MKTLIAVVFCLVFLLWGGSWYFLYPGLPEPTDRGQFGDMFGAVNSLFSGLAFAGVVIAILLQREELQQQREELKLQREELKLTRVELKRSASAQEKSEEALREQAGQLAHSARIQGLAVLVDTANRASGDPSLMISLSTNLMSSLQTARNSFLKELFDDLGVDPRNRTPQTATAQAPPPPSQESG